MLLVFSAEDVVPAANPAKLRGLRSSDRRTRSVSAFRSSGELGGFQIGRALPSRQCAFRMAFSLLVKISPVGKTAMPIGELRRPGNGPGLPPP